MSDSMHWQLDFYRRPLQDADGNPLWELLICSADRSFTYGEFCSQKDASAPWVRQQLQKACEHAGNWPDAIEIFRPQAISLVEVACRELPPSVKPTRDTPSLKQWLRQRAAWYPSLTNYVRQPYEPIALERPAPVPVSDHLMGDLWQFAAVSPDDLQRLCSEPIPIQSVPSEVMPIALGLPSTLPIPGVIIDGGRQSMRLAQWLQSARPVMLQYIAGMPDGLLLEAGLVDRWILTTFEDDDVAAAARTFTERKIAAKGLHFLLVRPDDSGMTYTGLWLLQQTPGKEVARAQSQG
ncbi:MAG: Tab2/Atab2 family RNA-binding protein [Cyanobacteria bacterium J06648_10]